MRDTKEEIKKATNWWHTENGWKKDWETLIYLKKNGISSGAPGGLQLLLQKGLCPSCQVYFMVINKKRRTWIEFSTFAHLNI